MIAGGGRLIRRPLAAVGRLQERRLLHRSAAPAFPPVFLLGPPRSGTTLLYQVLAECFEVAYICNGANRYPSCPAAATRLLRPAIRGHRSDFTSNYGSTRSTVGPSEGRSIWRRWFGDGYADERFLDAGAADEARRTVAAIESVLAAPFLNKDPHHSVRVRALDGVFPRSVFILIRRDPLATAESILAVRRRRFARGEAPLDRWMSVKPHEYESLKDTGYIEQICGQVVYCTANAREDLARVAAERSLEASYERLCDDTAAEIERIADFLSRRDVPLRRRHDPPATLRRSRGVDIPVEDREALRRGLSRLAGRG